MPTRKPKPAQKHKRNESKAPLEENGPFSGSPQAIVPQKRVRWEGNVSMEEEGTAQSDSETDSKILGKVRPNNFWPLLQLEKYCAHTQLDMPYSLVSTVCCYPGRKEYLNSLLGDHFTLIYSGRVGCAYYDPVKCLIYIFEDTQETPHFDLTTMRWVWFQLEALFNQTFYRLI